MTQTTTTSIDTLFAAGAHYGFTKRRRHPSVLPHLYGAKDGNDIINLEFTAAQLATVAKSIHDTIAAGKTVLLAGTKDEVASQVLAAGEAVNIPFVANRWIGGMLTNFSEIKKRIQRLDALQNEQESGVWERKYTKKERVMLGRELAKLQFNFGGIRTLTKVPDLVVVIDPRFEEIAVQEANTLGIPVVAVAGTDCNIQHITYPIVMNDALRGSVALALEVITEAVILGRSTYQATAAKTAATVKTATTTRS